MKLTVTHAVSLLNRLNMEQFDMLNVMLSNKTKPANEMNLLQWINFLKWIIFIVILIERMYIEIFTVESSYDDLWRDCRGRKL